jgi:hypothetical protein
MMLFPAHAAILVPDSRVPISPCQIQLWPIMLVYCCDRFSIVFNVHVLVEVAVSDTPLAYSMNNALCD